MRSKLVSILTAVVLFAAVLFPHRIVAQNGYPQLTNFVVVRPQAIPTSLTSVIVGQNAYVCYADFTATGQNILVEDQQATPIVWLNAVLGTGGNPTTWYFDAVSSSNCRPMPNGIQIQAGGAGVTGTMIIGCSARCVLSWGF